MKISLKIFLGYFLIVGLAAWFVLNVFISEIKPGVRQAMEDTLVDTANVLAELAAADFKSGTIDSGNFAKSIAQYVQRHPQANVWGQSKSKVGYHVTITNAKGIVVFDSQGKAVGQDYSKWNDVYLTLQGKYGVRSSPLEAKNPDGEHVMYVAAPIMESQQIGAPIIGVLTVSKANGTVQPFIERGRQKIMQWGAILVGLSLLLGGLFTWRLTRAIHRLRDYANAVANGDKAPPPDSSSDELSELAHAMTRMRHELDGKQYVENYVHHLTHELKSPLAAIHGAAELIDDHMPPATRVKFLGNIREQTNRLKLIIDNMLGLAAVEHQQQLVNAERLDLAVLAATQMAQLAIVAERQNIKMTCTATSPVWVLAERFLLAQAINNLLENALAFTPTGGSINVSVEADKCIAKLLISDTGSGIPDYAINKVFEKFYSLPRPTGSNDVGKKSTGLGLALVREVALLHHGDISLTNQATGGVLAMLSLPINQ